MRRQVLILCGLLTLCTGSSLTAQSLWSPCGCPDQGGACQSTVGGCQPECQPSCNTCGHGGCWQFHDPAYFQPWELRPFGAYNERLYEAQRQSGTRAQFVFYRFHFAINESDRTWKLTQAGEQNAQKLARMWSHSPSQILIESAGNAEWDAARRELAMQAMAANGVAAAPEAFVIGQSHILGLVPWEPDYILGRRQQLSPFLYGSSSSPSVDTGNSSGSSIAPSNSGSSPSGMSPGN